jgi:polysaccharide pyruvyl transferase WcaK-like protein
MELKNSGSDDRWLLNEIIKNILDEDKCYIQDEDLNTKAHFDLVQNCRYFIGHKTHSVIFALAAGTPLIGIAYHVKTVEFMTQFGVEKFAIADKVLTSEKLISFFEDLIIDSDNTGIKIFKKGREMTQIINRDFSTMINSRL